MMRKGHPLLPKINRIIDEETINIKRLHEKYYKYAKVSKCEEATKQIGPRALGEILFFVFFGKKTLRNVNVPEFESKKRSGNA
jgi:hypothetical protein